MIEHIDRRLPHVAGALDSREEIRGRCIDRPVAVPEPERVQDVTRIDVILDGELRYLVGGIVPPRREQPVAVLVALVEGRSLSPRILELRCRPAAALGDAPGADRALREALRLYRAIGATGHAARLGTEIAA